MNSKEFNDKVVSLSPKIFPMVARILDNREDARDAVQEVMMKLWEKRKQLGKQENLNGYVFLTARNYCIDRQRTNKRKINGSGKNTQAGLIDNIKVKEDVSLENRESYSLIINLINNLPDNQKEVILLRDVDGLEFDEIITLTGYKIENIRVWLSRARKRISRELTEIHSYERGTA
ncbi:MAG: RNA polymerase sigma factor [Marinilabiliaceae bacterium]|jgi:RNA polymerase sigma-70 factor (ECF subfamily)|nr:RNA polymerase sigma factor [Marinilabiliaceae bacterium]